MWVPCCMFTLTRLYVPRYSHNNHHLLVHRSKSASALSVASQLLKCNATDFCLHFTVLSSVTYLHFPQISLTLAMADFVTFSQSLVIVSWKKNIRLFLFVSRQSVDGRLSVKPDSPRSHCNTHLLLVIHSARHLRQFGRLVALFLQVHRLTFDTECQSVCFG